MPQDPITPRSRGGLLQASGRSVALLALGAALVFGIQLGGLPWRYRKQIWQLQGALVGLAAGFLAGRMGKLANKTD